MWSGGRETWRSQPMRISLGAIGVWGTTGNRGPRSITGGGAGAGAGGGAGADTLGATGAGAGRYGAGAGAGNRTGGGVAAGAAGAGTAEPDAGGLADDEVGRATEDTRAVEVAGAVDEVVGRASREASVGDAASPAWCEEDWTGPPTAERSGPVSQAIVAPPARPRRARAAMPMDRAALPGGLPRARSSFTGSSPRGA